MDIIDIILARALTPQGQIETYAAQAQRAVTNANTAVNNINNITQQTQDNYEASVEALNTVTQAMEDAQTLISELNSTTIIDNEINKLLFTISNLNRSGYIGTDIVLKYPDESIKRINDAIKYYTSTGNNTDGTMTQKAITDAISAAIGSGGSGGGGSTNLGPENSGNIVVIGPDGNIISGDTTEASIIEALIKSGSYVAKDAVGAEMDYENRVFSRTQESEYYQPGQQFDSYPMYGGRMRCNVGDNGYINAFYGDTNYKEDGSNGQVMIYQPKFYYQRVPIKTDSITTGNVIRKESIIISATAQAGLKIHPLFINENGEEVDYVLLPAYESCYYSVDRAQYDLNDSNAIDFTKDKLSSIAGAKPISGLNKNLTVTAAEQLAQNRGEGWHITNLACESAMQLLELIEFGSFNGQNALEAGICSIPNNSNANCASITGSTSSLGNQTGVASSTQNETAGKYTDYNTAGKRAITYRGMENPWGNIWRMIGGMIISGNGSQYGGEVYVCNNFNYNESEITSNYKSLSYYLPQTDGYISGFGYNSQYDWVFIPIECSNANSAVPVGDYVWSTPYLNKLNMATVGGLWTFGEQDGMFAYGFDKNLITHERGFSARLMFIPKKDAIYNVNINKWTNKRGA